MRFILISIVMALGVVGCGDETSDEAEALREQAEELNETRQEGAQDIAEARQEAAENTAEAAQDVVEAQRDLTEAQRDLARDEANEPRQAQPEADLRRDPPGSPRPDLQPEHGDGH
jgi:hypothetical protein